MVNEHRPPELRLALTEFPRAASESYKLLWQYSSLSKQVPRGNNQPILCISGYGAGDASMLPLRSFLKLIGYNPLKAEIGINIESKEDRIKSVNDATSFRHKMVDLLKERVNMLYQQHNQKVVLIGWSMGGLFAADVSQQIPDKVSQVITMGSPFGDPRGTSTFNLLRWINKSDIPIEEQDFDTWLNKRQMTSEEVPIKVLYSKSDGIVGESTARLHEHPAVEHIEVDSSHVGFAVNANVFKTIADCLAQSTNQVTSD